MKRDLTTGIYEVLLRDPEFQNEIEDQPQRFVEEWKEFILSVINEFSLDELCEALTPESFVKTRRIVLQHILHYDWVERFYSTMATGSMTETTLETAIASDKKNIAQLIETLEMMLEDFDDWMSGCSARDFLTHNDPEAGNLSEETFGLWLKGECATIGQLFTTQPFALLRSVT